MALPLLSANTAVDMFDTPLAVGDHVVSYNHVYVVEGISRNGYSLSCRIVSTAQRRPLKRCNHNEVVKMNADQIAVVEKRMTEYKLKLMLT